MPEPPSSETPADRLLRLAAELGAPRLTPAEGATSGMGGGRPPPSDPPRPGKPPPNPPPPFPTDQVVLAVAGACFAAPICKIGWDTMLGSDWFSASWWKGLLEVGVGLVIGLGGASFHWWRNRIDAQTRGRIERNAIRWWLPAAVIAIFAYIVGPNIYQRARAPAPGPVSAQDMASAIVAAIKPQLDQLLQNRAAPALSQPDQGELASTKKQLQVAQAQLKQYQVESEQAQWNNMSAACTNALTTSIENNLPGASVPKTIIVATGPPSVMKLRDNILSVISTAINRLEGKSGFSADHLPTFTFGPPVDYDRDLDAPRLPPGSTAAGIVIHGRNAAADFLVERFSMGLIVHQTSDLPADALLAYYHRRSSSFVPYGAIIWIEIGEGSPWRTDGLRC